MSERNSRAATSVAAAALILALTAAFSVIGVDLARRAFDPTRIDRETYFSAIDFGLNQEETQNLMGISAVVILGLCVLSTVLWLGVLGRRDSVRHAAIGTFIVFAAVTFPLSVAEILSRDPEPTAALGLAVAAADAAVVILLLHPRTSADFERAEGARERARAARRAERSARRAGGSRASETG